MDPDCAVCFCPLGVSIHVAFPGFCVGGFGKRFGVA
jgi:hypothetical protein